MKQTQPHLNITPTPINNIHEAPDNPRIISPRAIDIVAASIDRFGWQQPIVTTTDGEIIAGHTRYKAAKQLGHTTVPVLVADNLTDDEVKAYRIADNRSGDFSSWDIPRLVDELEDLDGRFNDELALEDWEQIMAEYDQAVAEDSATLAQDDAAAGPTTPGENPAPDAASRAGDAVAVDTDLPDDAAAYLRRGGHVLTVVFDSDDSLMNGRRALLDMPGVIDVQDKRAY